MAVATVLDTEREAQSLSVATLPRRAHLSKRKNVRKPPVRPSRSVVTSSDVLRRRLPKEKSREQDIADLVVEGTALNAYSLRTWGSEIFSGATQKVDLTSLGPLLRWLRNSDAAFLAL